jgi:hypothetical protein
LVASPASKVIAASRPMIAAASGIVPPLLPNQGSRSTALLATRIHRVTICSAAWTGK